VDVGVDEPGEDGASVDIHELGPAGRATPDLVVGSDRHDRTVADEHRVGPGESRAGRVAASDGGEHPSVHERQRRCAGMGRPRIVRPVLAVHDVSEAVRCRLDRVRRERRPHRPHAAARPAAVASVDGDVSCLILERPVSV
jgi:hypothetical protein